METHAAMLPSWTVIQTRRLDRGTLTGRQPMTLSRLLAGRDMCTQGSCSSGLHLYVPGSDQRDLVANA